MQGTPVGSVGGVTGDGKIAYRDLGVGAHRPPPSHPSHPSHPFSPFSEAWDTNLDPNASNPVATTGLLRRISAFAPVASW